MTGNLKNFTKFFKTKQYPEINKVPNARQQAGINLELNRVVLAHCGNGTSKDMVLPAVRLNIHLLLEKGKLRAFAQ